MCVRGKLYLVTDKAAARSGKAMITVQVRFLCTGIVWYQGGGGGDRRKPAEKFVKNYNRACAGACATRVASYIRQRRDTCWSCPAHNRVVSRRIDGETSVCVPFSLKKDTYLLENNKTLPEALGATSGVDVDLLLPSLMAGVAPVLR